MLIFLKTFNSEFSYIEVWFADHISKLLEIEDKINIILVSNLWNIQNDSLFNTNLQTEYLEKVMGKSGNSKKTSKNWRYDL